MIREAGEERGGRGGRKEQAGGASSCSQWCNPMSVQVSRIEIVSCQKLFCVCEDAAVIDSVKQEYVSFTMKDCGEESKTDCIGRTIS